MYFVTIAAKNLFRRKLRTLFTLLGIASAVAAFIALVGLSRGFENAWMHALLERDTHIFAVPRGVVDILSASINEHKVEEMAEVKGILDASAELLDMVDLDTGEMVIVAGWPLDSYLWGSVYLDSGTIPDKTIPNGIILGNNVATSLGLKLGESFDIKTMTFTVVGISSTGGGVMRNQAMVVSLDALQELNNREDQASTINFRLEEYTNREKVAGILALLNEKFPDFVFTEALDLAKNNKILGLFRAMAWGTSIIALFIGLVVIINTLLMSVMERTKEFGLLSSLGWSAMRILGLIIIEGVTLSLSGGLLGAGIGIAGLYTIANSPHMQGLIQPDINILLFCEMMTVTLFLGLGGSIYPAWRAIRLRPAKALRHE